MRVIYNQGDQRISVVPIHPATGAPVVVDSATNVTCTIVDLREHDEATDHTVLATTVVAQDPLNLALTAAAGYSEANPQSLTLDASTAVVGRTYLLEDTDGTREVVQLSAINGTSGATLRWPLRGNYSVGATLRGVEFSATFPAAEADDEDSVEDMGGPYLVTWTYTLDGQLRDLISTLWVDRYSVAPPIDDAWVLIGQPQLASRARGRVEVRDAIVAAWQDWLAMVQSHGKDPSLFPPSHTAKVGLRKLALSYLNRWVAGGDTDTDYADKLEEKAHELFSNALVGRAPKDQVELTRDDVDHVAQPKAHFWRLS